MAARKRPRLEAKAKADLLDTLWTATPVARLLVSMLQVDGSLQNVRLACRGLRSYVDEHVSSLVIAVCPADKARWAAGDLPSLERWPTCSNVDLTLDYPSSDAPDVDCVFLAGLPFLGLPPKSLERFQSLKVACSRPMVPSWQAEALVSSMAAMLPGLRRLSIHGLTSMSFEPPRQQVMYENLAALPHLMEMALPSCRALPTIGALSATLTKLQITDGEMTAQAAGGLARLQHLRSIAFGPRFVAAATAATQKATAYRSLKLLLNSLPPSVVRVTFRDQEPGAFFPNVPVRLQLRDGRCSAVFARMGSKRGHAARPCIVTAIVTALVGSRALGPQLDCISLDSLCVGGGVALDAPAYAPLWSLLRRCARLDVRELHASSAAAAVRALARIGRPRRLVLQTNAPDGGLARVRLRLRAARVVQAPWGIDTSEEAHVQGQGQGTASMPRSPLGPSTSASPLRPGTAPAPRSPALPLSPDATGLALPAEAASPGAELTISMLQAMLGRLIGGASALRYNGTGSGAALAPALATASQPPAGNLAAVIAAARVAPEPAPDGSSSRLLLLCGPFVASWAADTRTLHDVMRSLAVHAAAARRARKGATAGSSDLFLSYQLLPASVAVLLTCADAEAAVDVAAAVAVLAGVCRGLAFDLDVLPVAAEVDANPVAEVEAANLVAEAEVGSRPEGGPVERFGREVVLQALQEVLQSLWDELHGSCGGGPAAELALLRRLLGGWEQLAAEMPAEVAL